MRKWVIVRGRTMEPNPGSNSCVLLPALRNPGAQAERGRCLRCEGAGGLPASPVLSRLTCLFQWWFFSFSHWLFLRRGAWPPPSAFPSPGRQVCPVGCQAGVLPLSRKGFLGLPDQNRGR